MRFGIYLIVKQRRLRWACANSQTYESLTYEMNLIFEMFMESWILRDSCKVSEAWRLTLQETRSIHDSMNIPKIKFIAYIYTLL